MAFWGCKEIRQDHRNERIISLSFGATSDEINVKHVFNIGAITSLSK